MARHKARDNMGVFMSQVAGGFATVSMPVRRGPSFVNLQFLRKSGYRNTQATTAIMSAALVVYYAVYFSMLVIIGLFTGRNMFSRRNPDKHVGYRAGRCGRGAVHCDDDSAVAPLGDPSVLCRWPRRISTSC